MGVLTFFGLPQLKSQSFLLSHSDRQRREKPRQKDVLPVGNSKQEVLDIPMRLRGEALTCRMCFSHWDMGPSDHHSDCVGFETRPLSADRA